MTCFKYQVYLYGSEAIKYSNTILWEPSHVKQLKKQLSISNMCTIGLRNILVATLQKRQGDPNTIVYWQEPS